MAGLETLIKVAERRAQEVVLEWQRLNSRRDDAKAKLARLQKHAQGYRDLMQTGLRHGMPAAAIAAHLGFIAQIDAVLSRQQIELEQLETACAQHWEVLVNARREQRIYEMLSERCGAREAAAELRRQQAEIGEILQRAARASPPAAL
jgi:flagellar export protein FliJ